ncbi:MAG: efflux RND transporter periplasmic adaptor subunit [Proteobacteria bacterium]|nr:efflux RND transporter periplasmic adaptor subunit [Pseudomonadota bacterium]
MKKIFLKLNKNVKLALLIVLLVCVWFISGIFTGPDDSKRREVIKEARVFVKEINPIDYKDTVQVVGRTDVAQKVDLVSEVSGKVSKINKKQGDFVKKGDLMLVIENGYIKDRLTSAEESLKAAKLKLDIAKGLAKNAYKAKTDLADRQSDYSRALSNYVDMKRDYDNSFVNAPIDGAVESKNVDLGDYVKSDTILYKIISQDEVLLVGYLSQFQLSKVKLNQKAYGSFKTRENVEGKVTFISNEGDERTKTYKIEVTVDSKQQNIDVKAGLSTRIHIPVGEIKVYQVPHSALVIDDDGLLGVRVVTDEDIVEFKEVKILKDNSDKLMVKIDDSKPLNVILRGQLDVKQGLKVQVSYSDDLTKKTEKTAKN